MGMKSWEAALADIDHAILSHESTFNQKNLCSCQTVARLFRVKALIHTELSQTEEAASAKQRADRASTAHGANRYGGSS